MGRGRAKAKQTKVARQLKYGGGGTDLNRLKHELGVADTSVTGRGVPEPRTDAADAACENGDEYDEAS
jgi:hypothetical protein